MKTERDFFDPIALFCSIVYNVSDMDLSFLEQTIERLGHGKQALIPILQAIQEHYRYLPRECMEYVCAVTEITPSDIVGVSTFYNQFRHEPVGEHIVHVCTGTACHVKGANLILDAFRLHLGIKPEEDTDKDGKFTIQKVACLGCCTLAPVVQIDDATYGHLTPSMIPDVLEDFLGRTGKTNGHASKLAVAKHELGEIRIGLGSCCQAQGSGKVRDEILNVLNESGSSVRVKPVGCVGMCHQTPLVETVSKAGISTFYAKVQPEDVREIILDRFEPADFWQRTGLKIGKWLKRFWSDEFPDASEFRKLETETGPVCTFLNRQKHLAMEHCGEISPSDIEEYIQYGGFEGFKRVLNGLSPEEVISEIETAGIRGRGGAGFPTSRKWQAVKDAIGSPKYIVCNGDEGDPGAFMDRMLLESFPYRVIEGMAIAAKTVGANEGYLYIRAEYPLAVKRIRHAILECHKRGVLGDDIFGTGFSLRLHVMEGAGAFVCGEETALLESIEGRRGMPRLRPPYPANSGLFGKPTLVNNVETFTLVSWVLNHSGEEFVKFGTRKSAGTKVFALAGKVKRGGLIEVPMGITIREVVEEIGGGIEGGKKFKGVQIGGPSGGCVPANLSDTPINFESLSKVGAIMGSGGLVVLDEDDCMVDIARYFLQFTQEQSCGKCTFCRVGTKRMLDILERLCNGKGCKGDIEKLETLAESIRAGSLCGLGKTAPNPVLSTIRYFRDEYEAHILGRCTAGKCQALIEYRINEKCNGCTLCARTCPVEAIESVPYRKHEIDLEKCTRCDSCRGSCPYGAIEIHSAGHICGE